MSQVLRLNSIVRFLYNHNPFYVISAVCLIYAMKLVFRPGEVSYIDPWALLAAISSYTLLMALTGFLIVRLGQVWEDTRSIFLVLLLLFLATSVTFDELLNLNPASGIPLILIGYALAATVSESLFFGLSIRLRAGFRIPYHLWLILLYFFPLFVSPELTGLGILATSWRLLLFPILASVLALSLIPAVRKGAAYCSENGTPWRWPLFPWSLFLFIWLANGFRTYAITISFLPSDAMQTAFQTYFLVPLVFSMAVLLMEMGFVERRTGLSAFALWSFPILLWLANQQAIDSVPATQFLDALTNRFGSPLWITILAYLGLCTYAIYRGDQTAPGWAFVALIVAMRVGPETQFILQPGPMQIWPFLILAGWMGSVGIRRRLSVPTVLATICISVICLSYLTRIQPLVWARVESIHLALFGVLLIGCTFRDTASRLVRVAGAISLPLVAILIWGLKSQLAVPYPVLIAHTFCLLAVTLICWRVSRDPGFLHSMLVQVVSEASGAAFYLGYILQRQIGLEPMLALFLGVSSFLMAASISTIKGRRGHNPQGAN